MLHLLLLLNSHLDYYFSSFHYELFRLFGESANYALNHRHVIFGLLLGNVTPFLNNYFLYTYVDRYSYDVSILPLCGHIKQCEQFF